MRIELRVRYQETDQMGVVYHTNYLVWCEMGRTDLLRSTGLSYRDMEREGVMLPVTEVNCRYLAPATYDDMVVVETSIIKLTGVRISFRYRIFHGEQDTLLAEAVTHHGFVNGQGRPVNIKKKAPHWWELLQELS